VELTRVARGAAARCGRLLSGRGPGARAVPVLGDRSVVLVEVRAALAAGASPGAALAAAVDHDPHAGAPAVALAQAVRLGTPLADLAPHVATGDAALDLLVRALAVAERTGGGGLAAVDQALAAAAEAAEADRRLSARTAQARGTAAVLTVLPLAAWGLLVVLDPGLLRFYATGPGAATGTLAVVLALAGRRWSSRIVARAGRAAADADPLTPRAAPPDRRRAATAAVPALVVVTLAAGPLPGVAAAVAAAAVALHPPRLPAHRSRPPGAHPAGGARPSRAARAHRSRPAGARGRRPDGVPQPGPAAVASAGAGAGGGGAGVAAGGGAAEAVELLAVALAAGLTAAAAAAVVAGLGPPAARPALSLAAHRLRGGWDATDALAGGGLAAAGRVLAAADRWGAPAAPALRHLAADLRSRRRAAAEEAAERAQLALVFPTTLLTLPAFTVGAVPPMLWSAFSGAGG